jgi:DNA-binding transcriptional LysR family regulator
MRNREFDELATFVAIADHRSFARAADQLGLSPSALSKRLKQLESRVGAELVMRTTHAVSLTEAGARMYEHASRALQELAQAQVVVSGLSVEPVGNLRVAAPTSFANAVLAPILARFVDRYPQVNVALRLAEPVEASPDEHTDVVIRASADPPPGCAARLLLKFRWRLVATPSYLERAGSPAVPRDLAAHRSVTFGEEVPHGRFWHARTRTEQQVEFSRYLTANGVESVLAAVMAGAGVGLLPSYLVDAAIARRDLAAVLDDWRPVHAPAGAMHAIYRRSRLPIPKVGAFLEFVTSALAAPRGR